MSRRHIQTEDVTLSTLVRRLDGLIRESQRMGLVELTVKLLQAQDEAKRTHHVNGG